MQYKVRVRQKPSGSQENFAMVRNNKIYDTSRDAETEVRDTIQAVPRKDANLEAEKGETVLVNAHQPSFLKIGGKKHYDGGTPLNVPEGSFIFSDYLKIKDNDLLTSVFGMPKNKKGYSPAEISKKFPINDYIVTLRDELTDPIAKRTAFEMYQKNMEKLGMLALAQESMKGFEDGIPAIAESVMAGLSGDAQQVAKMGGLKKYLTNDEVNNSFSKIPITPNGVSSQPTEVPTKNTGVSSQPTEVPTKNTFVANPSQTIWVDGVEYRFDKSNAVDNTYLFKSTNPSDKKTITFNQIAFKDSYINKKPYTVLAEDRKRYNRYNIGATKEESIYNPTSYKMGKQEFVKGDVIYLGDTAYQIEGEDILNKGDIKYPMKELSQTTRQGEMFVQMVDKSGAKDKPVEVLKLQPVTVKYDDKGVVSSVNPIPKKSTKFVGDQTEQIYYLTPERLSENESQGKFSFAKRATPVAPVKPVGTGKNNNIPVNQHPPASNNKTPNTTPNSFSDIRKMLRGGTLRKYQITGEVDDKETLRNEAIKKYGYYEEKIDDHLTDVWIGNYKVRYRDNKPVGVKLDDGTIYGMSDDGTYMVNINDLSDTKQFGQYDEQLHLIQIAKDRGVYYDPTSFTNVVNIQAPQRGRIFGLEMSKDQWADFERRHGDFTTTIKDDKGNQKYKSFDEWKNKVESGNVGSVADFQKSYNNYIGYEYFKPSSTGTFKDPYGVDDKLGWITFSAPALHKSIPPDKDFIGPPEYDYGTPDTTKTPNEEDKTYSPPKRTKFFDTWFAPDITNFVGAITDKINRYEPAQGKVSYQGVGYDLLDPTRQLAANQEQMARYQSQIENSSDANVGLAAMLAASGAGFQNAASVLGNIENQNVAIVNNAYAQNAQIKNSEQAANEQMRQQYIGQMATLNQNEDEARNVKKWRAISAWNQGHENYTRDKLMEEVLFPQMHFENITGDYTFAGGRDPLANEDVYQNVYTMLMGQQGSRGGRRSQSFMNPSEYISTKQQINKMFADQGLVGEDLKAETDKYMQQYMRYGYGQNDYQLGGMYSFLND